MSSPYGSNPRDFSNAPPPPYPTAPGPGSPPANYLVWAILTTIFCFLPLGVASIVFAAQVNSKWAMGDVAGAQAASARAKKFAIWSAITSAALVVLYIVFMVLFVGLASTGQPTPTVTSL